LNHSTYSADLSSPKYFLFSKLKLQLKGQRFNDISNTETAVTNQLKTITKEEFSTIIIQLESRAQQHIDYSKDIKIDHRLYNSRERFTLYELYLKNYGPHCVISMLSVSL
ncbi:hypothetical protein X777_13501, partial [Ooceraea biroi]